MIAVTEFLARVEQIAAEEPSYRLGGSGRDGTCDCIGLIIGAIERAGGKWPGIHGSNYAAHARGVLRGLYKIGTVDSLRAGDLVFKAYQPGDPKYALPAKYRKGGDFFNGDLADYYHVGVVISVDPLRIRHMTTPRPKVDVKMGKWAYFGQLSMVGEKREEEMPMGTAVSYQRTVTGGSLNMRSRPSTSADRIARIPEGTVVDVTEELDDGWVRISYDGRDGYVMAKYLSDGQTDAAQVIVDRARLEKLYDELGDILGLRG